MAVDEIQAGSEDDAQQAKLDRERSRELENNKREARKGRVRNHVLQALGAPADLLRVQVRPLWGRNYRVNIMTGADAACARIPHSYFVVTDGDGKVLSSTPPLTRQY